jgi:hypothetical protein
VWYKHRDNFFLPTYAEVISMGLVRAANTVYESVVFSSIVYWMIGYARDAGETATPLWPGSSTARGWDRCSASLH